MECTGGYAGRYGSGNVFTKRRRMRFGWVFAAVLLAALVICTGYTAIDNGHVQVRKQRVFCADLRKPWKGLLCCMFPTWVESGLVRARRS